jgi:hypothetical protein
MNAPDTNAITQALSVLPSDVDGRPRAVLDVLQWFTFDHLPQGLPRSVSAMIAAVAGDVITMIDVDDPELTRGLVALRDAKDCLVRAAIVASREAAGQ